MPAITLHYHVTTHCRALGTTALPRESRQSTELQGRPLNVAMVTKFVLGAEIYTPTGLFVMPNTHRRRDETVLSRCVGVGGVYWA